MEKLKQRKQEMLGYLIIAAVALFLGIRIDRNYPPYFEYNAISREICRGLANNGKFPEITEQDLEEIEELETESVRTDWQEILCKPANKITKQEYLQLADLLIQTGDAKLLENMLNQCYDYIGTEKWYYEGRTVTVRSYHTNEKVKELTAAVNEKLLLLQTACVGKEMEINRQIRRNAICINQLLQIFLPFSEDLDIATTENIFGEEKITSERLIEVAYDSDKQLQLQFFQYSEENPDGENQQPTVITVSNAVTGMTGDSKIRDDGYTDRERFPYMGESMRFADIILMGAVIDTFDITYVSFEIKGMVNLHAYSLYPSETSQDWIRAFNEYMQSGSGALHARPCGYTELPEGELTMEVLMTYPDKVCEMFDTLYEKEIIGYELNMHQEMLDIYWKITKEEEK